MHTPLRFFPRRLPGFRDFLKRYKTSWLFARNFQLRIGQPAWHRILGADNPTWSQARSAGRGGPRVLIASSVGGNLPGTTFESLLAVALTLRGAEVEILLCDRALPACMESVIGWFPRVDRFTTLGPARDLCSACFSPAEKMFHSLGLRLHRYTDWLTPSDFHEVEEIAGSTKPNKVGGFRMNGIPLGEHALAGALRFYATGSLERQPGAEAVLGRYFKASLITARAVQRLVSSKRFDAVVLMHGIYVPQGCIAEVARHNEIRVVTWNPAYRKGCFIFSHHDTYHHTLMDEPVSAWEDIPWSNQFDSALMEYLESRSYGTRDWISFHDKPDEDMRKLEQEVGVNFSRPVVGLLTNVLWDAQIHYPANAFPNMSVWLMDTIRYFSTREDLQLLIRIHPAELRGTLPSRQPVLAEIRKAFPRLPKNVFVIPPDSRVSTYAAMLGCNAVLIYGTKTGVELACRGVPVIVAGEAWIRNKGISWDATTPEEYFEILRRLPLPFRLSEDQVRRARKYAFHFFFRRMIPVGLVKPSTVFSPYRLAVPDLASCLAGRSIGLDIICEGIVDGKEFVYPAEQLLGS